MARISSSTVEIFQGAIFPKFEKMFHSEFSFTRAEHFDSAV